MKYKLGIDPRNHKNNNSKKISLMIINNEGNIITSIPFEELVSILEKHKYKVIRDVKEPNY